VKPARILITGAGGFVGGALAVGFAELGWQVLAMDRSFDAGPSHPNIRQFVADLAKGEWAKIPELDVVVHAAWTTTDPATLGITATEYEGQNLLPLTTVLRYVTHLSPAAFVFVSSSGVFSADDADDGLTDRHTPTGTSAYATAKLRCESMAASLGHEALGQIHVVRLGYLFGPGEVARPTRPGVSLVARWMAAANEGRGLEVRDDDPAREWTFTPDLAPALERLVAHPSERRPIHLGSPHVLRDSELAGLIVDEFPGTDVVTVPAGAPVKPPMLATDRPALRDFPWTDPATGIRALLNAEAVA